MDSLSKYFRDTFAEMKHVAWPTQAQAFKYTALVVGISLFVALFVSLFDYIFSQGIDLIITSF